MKSFLMTLCLVLSLLVCSCSKAPVITVHNDSSVMITSLSLIGSGFSETIPSLAPGRAISVTVHPKGESGLEIQFDTPKGHKRKDDLAYIEASGGYRVTVNIDEKLEITAKSDLGA